LLDGYVRSGNVVKARKLIQDLLANARTKHLKDSATLADELVTFAQALIQIDHFQEAEQLLRESLAIREMLHSDSWHTFYTQSLLGGALLGQKNYIDAEPMLLKSYEGMKAREKKIPPQGEVRLHEALGRLIELYAATGKPDEAKRYKELLAKYPTPKETLPPRADK
jgi:hypothetical protein